MDVRKSEFSIAKETVDINIQCTKLTAEDWLKAEDCSNIRSFMNITKCGMQNNGPQRCSCPPTSRTCEYVTLHGKTDFANVIKDLEIILN